MAKRRRRARKNEHSEMKMLLLTILMFFYLMGPYMDQPSTTAHLYYGSLMDGFYDSLSEPRFEYQYYDTEDRYYLDTLSVDYTKLIYADSWVI